MSTTTFEKDRILALPVKAADMQIPDLTAVFQRVKGQRPWPGPLTPTQSEWLFWCWKLRQDYPDIPAGVLGHLPVGSGKTLCSYLTPLAAGLKRPLLLVPAKLREKTFADFNALRPYWQVPPQHTVLSYEELSSRRAASILEQISPDGIICDEAHRLKAATATRTKRFIRFIRKHLDCRVYDMSGTFLDMPMESLSLLSDIVLRELSPVPALTSYPEVQAWGALLDDQGQPGPSDYGMFRPVFNAWAPDLRAWDGTLEARKTACREAFDGRFRSTPGVVVSRGSSFGGSLVITLRDSVAIPLEVRRTMEHVEMKWETPDGSIVFSDPMEVSRCLRQLACGFWYRWAWERVGLSGPDEQWQSARKFWGAQVRDWLGGMKIPPVGLDSEALLGAACERGDGRLPPIMLEAWRQWREVKDRWRVDYGGRHDERSIPVVPVWVDEFLIDDALAWARAQGEPVIIWYHHRAVGQVFARRARTDPDVEVYGPDRSPPEGPDAQVPPIAVMSAKAHGEGKNLQAWGNQLVLAAHGNAIAWEQLLGRTHRKGQRRDEVCAAVNTHTSALRRAWESALVSTQAAVERGAGEKKLLLATVVRERF